MVRNYNSDRIRKALSEDFHTDNSMAHHLNSQVDELPRSEVYADPRSGTSMMTQIALEQDEIMEDADSGDEEYSALIKDHSEFNVADYMNEAGDGISAAPNSTIINSYEITQDSIQNREAFNSFPAGGSPLFMLGTSDGVLNNSYAMDDLTTLTRKYGVCPFIKKTARASIGFDGATADMCFYNFKLSHLLSQKLIAEIPMPLAPMKNVTLVLDIDGTLIHSSNEDNGADFSFPILRKEKEHTMYVKKRPHVDAFLKKVAEMFHVTVFTAGVSHYANPLLDILDSERLISRRYYRNSCVLVDGTYLKDLTIIEADLAKVAIIDNTPAVYQLQVNNGIPIKTWSSDPCDVSLLKLIPFLETFAVAEDVRPIIANKFARYTLGDSNTRN